MAYPPPGYGSYGPAPGGYGAAPAHHEAHDNRSSPYGHGAPPPSDPYGGGGYQQYDSRGPPPRHDAGPPPAHGGGGSGYGQPPGGGHDPYGGGHYDSYYRQQQQSQQPPPGGYPPASSYPSGGYPPDSGYAPPSGSYPPHSGYSHGPPPGGSDYPPPSQPHGGSSGYPPPGGPPPGPGGPPPGDPHAAHYSAHYGSYGPPPAYGHPGYGQPPPGYGQPHGYGPPPPGYGYPPHMPPPGRSRSPRRDRDRGNRNDRRDREKGGRGEKGDKGGKGDNRRGKDGGGKGGRKGDDRSLPPAASSTEPKGRVQQWLHARPEWSACWIEGIDPPRRPASTPNVTLLVLTNSKVKNNGSEDFGFILAHSRSWNKKKEREKECSKDLVALLDALPFDDAKAWSQLPDASAKQEVESADMERLTAAVQTQVPKTTVELPEPLACVMVSGSSLDGRPGSDPDVALLERLDPGFGELYREARRVSGLVRKQWFLATVTVRKEGTVQPFILGVGLATDKASARARAFHSAEQRAQILTEAMYTKVVGDGGKVSSESPPPQMPPLP